MECLDATVVSADVGSESRSSLAVESPRDCVAFELVGWQSERIKIFGVTRVRNTNSYPIRTGHVMFVDVDDNY